MNKFLSGYMSLQLLYAYNFDNGKTDNCSPAQSHVLCILNIFHYPLCDLIVSGHRNSTWPFHISETSAYL